MKEPTQRSTEFMTMKNRDKIYDCFCFFNEFDILDLRLNILDPYVDYFVICESSVTHTGAEKPFYFEENRDKFEKFLDKIIHVKVEDTPDKFYDIPEIANPATFDLTRRPGVGRHVRIDGCHPGFRPQARYQVQDVLLNAHPRIDP